MNVYIDLDDTVADFRTYAEKVLNRKLTENCHDLSEDDWKALSVHPVYLDLQLIEGALNMVNQIIQDFYHLGYHISFLTAIPKHMDRKTVVKHKAMWVNRHFPGVPIILVDSTMDKLNYCHFANILIDDKLRLIEAWNNLGGTGIHHTSVEDTLEQLKHTQKFNYVLGEND